jgi:hypothetical protein
MEPAGESQPPFVLKGADLCGRDILRLLLQLPCNPLACTPFDSRKLLGYSSLKKSGPAGPLILLQGAL